MTLVETLRDLSGREVLNFEKCVGDVGKCVCDTDKRVCDVGRCVCDVE